MQKVSAIHLIPQRGGRVEIQTWHGPMKLGSFKTERDTALNAIVLASLAQQRRIRQQQAKLSIAADIVKAADTADFDTAWTKIGAFKRMRIKA